MSTSVNSAAPKTKKPIYKRVWFWIIIVLVLFGIGSGLGAQNNKSSSEASPSSTSASSATSEDTNDKNKTTTKDNNTGQDDLRAKFDSIELGQDSGATKEVVEQLMGKKADSSSTQDISGIQADSLTWNLGLMKTITVGFTNDHAVTKAVIGLKGSKEITLEDFNTIQNGMSEADVAASLGEPTSISVSNILGTTTSIKTYSGKDLGSVGTVTFTNGAVSGVANTNLK